LFVVSAALAQKRRELHEKEINERKSKKTPISPMSQPIVSLEEQEREAQAMTIQVLYCFECLHPSSIRFDCKAVVDVVKGDSVS
jgi:hypothetical protein